MGHVLQTDLASLPYEARLGLLAERRVGLWDAVASALREGSLDGAIRGPIANPLADLVRRLPHLKAVASNGKKAAQIATRELAAASVPVITLPSSSPAYAAMPMAEKQLRWQELRRFL